jgi:hypothetical protein
MQTQNKGEKQEKRFYEKSVDNRHKNGIIVRQIKFAKRISV